MAMVEHAVLLSQKKNRCLCDLSSQWCLQKECLRLILPSFIHLQEAAHQLVVDMRTQASLPCCQCPTTFCQSVCPGLWLLCYVTRPCSLVLPCNKLHHRTSLHVHKVTSCMDNSQDYVCRWFSRCSTACNTFIWNPLHGFTSTPPQHCSCENA